MDNKVSLNYYDNNGDTKTMELRLKFLTPLLRTRIINHSLNSQKALKELHEKTKDMITDHSGWDTEVADYMESQVELNPDITDEELASKKELFLSEKLAGISDEEYESNAKVEEMSWKFAEESNIRMFKLITDTRKLSEEDKDLYNQAFDGEFWSNVDFNTITETNNTFRSYYKIGR